MRSEEGAIPLLPPLEEPSPKGEGTGLPSGEGFFVILGMTEKDGRLLINMSSWRALASRRIRYPFFSIFLRARNNKILCQFG